MMASASDPLAHFVKLGPSVYLQDPIDSTNQASRPLILIAFWMNAPPRALAKYVVEYRRRVPSARIVFMRSSSSDFFWGSTTRAQQARAAPAVEALRSLAPGSPVFMHLFSNGGLSNTTHLLQAYFKATGKPLLISSMIIDSAPGTATITAAMRAFSFALPQMWILRLISKSVLWLSLVLIKIVQAVTGSLDPISLARKLINDTSLVQAVNPKVPTRCYIYSDTDELVDWHDVEKHARESEASGWIVRRELFQGTPHVGHMRAEPDRYWGIVKAYLEPSISA
jgi:hypothetical protein